MTLSPTLPPSLTVNAHHLVQEYAEMRRQWVGSLALSRVELSIMHGNGNVIAVLDEGVTGLSSGHVTGELARAICLSFHSLRVDGICFLRRSSGALSMIYFERDGTHSTMCGNGLRCSAHYAYDRNYIAAQDRILTEDGWKTVTVSAGTVRVGLGPAREFRRLDSSSAFVFTGLPHLVLFVDNLDSLDVRTAGALLRYDKALCDDFGHPEGIHVDFVQHLRPDQIRVRTYEVGVEDETLSCGTGAVASAYVAHRMNDAPFPVQILTAGGELVVGQEQGGLTLSGVTDYLWRERHGPSP